MAISDVIRYDDEYYEDQAPIFYDTETCGFYGFVVLIQYAIGDGHTSLYNVWHNTAAETMRLIEGFMNHPGGVVGFNLTFDHFHLSKCYSVLSKLPRELQTVPLEDIIDEVASREKEAVFCKALKPQKCLDLMLHARRGPYQTCMDRSDIRLRRVPTPIAYDLAKTLTDEIPLDDVLFARRKDPSVRWQVKDIEDEDGEVIEDFKDVLLKFSPSSALKALVKHAGISKKKRLLFKNVDLGDEYRPEEYGYAPYACVAVKKPWTQVIKYHIDHWAYNSYAREYASDDVEDTRNLYKHFHEPHIVEQFGAPKFDDDDSILACMVATVRWRGFRIDVDGIREMYEKAKSLQNKSQYNFNATEICRKYLRQVLTPETALILTDEHTGKITTRKSALLELAQQKVVEVCDDCFGEGADWEGNQCKPCLGEGLTPILETVYKCDSCVTYDKEGEAQYSKQCDMCNGYGYHYEENEFEMQVPKVHPAARRAQEILDYRIAGKEIELYEKLLLAERFHASFKIIGTLSGRMAGADKLNAQGVKHDVEVRNKFPLYDEGYVLCGGDFDGFEVALMEAAYEDPKLREDLLTGKKMHGLFGMHLFPGNSYEAILATKELPGELNLYGRSKTGVFAVAYGGDENTLAIKVGIPVDVGLDAYQSWCNRYTVWGERRKEIFDMFCSMRQPGGIGTKVEWHEPADKIVSMFGFPRYFHLEMQICEKLFRLAEKPPKEWQKHKSKVVRKDREQSVGGAARSALLAASFGVQSSCMRAAANHVIQSSGASITKMLQAGLWRNFQPCGIHEFKVIPMNVHDEVMAPTKPEIAEEVKNWVDDFVISLKPKVPLIAMTWAIGLKDWSGKS